VDGKLCPLKQQRQFGGADLPDRGQLQMFKHLSQAPALKTS
jgi:hypothetical protein